MPDTLWYVYGVMPASFSPASLPEGIDDAPVVLERDGDTAALVSVLPADRYGPEALERLAGDVDWLGPRALAHDRILSWASDHAPVVPFPMFSLFSGGAAVHRMLDERAGTLASALARAAAGREYALRVYRVDAELEAVLTELSPRLAEMAKQGEGASPGQRYLLDRKLAAAKKDELRGVSMRIATELYESLAGAALDAVREPLPKAPDDKVRGIMILNAAFLVSADGYDAFRARLSRHVAEHQAHGLRFDFTGPWPVYHFAGGTTDA